MEKLAFSLVLLLFSVQIVASASDPLEFIKVSCKATRYPDVCLKCLLGYADKIQQNEQQLALAALTVSAARARSATVFVAKLARLNGIKRREYQAVKDCIQNLVDSVNQLSQSTKELGGMGGRFSGLDFTWHMSNLQTWVSAALTDQNTCLDGFSGSLMNGNIKVAIRGRVVDVARVTSNALALVTRFGSKHSADAASSEKP